MLRFDNVSLCLKDNLILKDLSFEIQQGQSVLLVGSSGAGKSTILRLVLGLTKPTSGKVFIFGQNINHLDEKYLNDLRRNFGMVFQDNALFDSITVEENIGFFLNESLQLAEGEIRERVSESLTLLGLQQARKSYPSELSGGMKKRVAIARAVVTYPKVILYDEPTAGLDPVVAGKVVNLIYNLQQNFQMTSLVVTHEIHHFVKRVDRLLMLKNGIITYDGEPDLAILDQYEEQQTPSRC